MGFQIFNSKIKIKLILKFQKIQNLVLNFSKFSFKLQKNLKLNFEFFEFNKFNFSLRIQNFENQFLKNSKLSSKIENLKCQFWQI